MVHARSVNGTDLTFIVSGMLWRNSLVMQDEETGTLWSQVSGKAMRGPLAGKQLKMLAAVQTTWAEWKRAHPGTLVLEKERAFASSAYEKYATDPRKFGILRTREIGKRLPGKALVYGVVVGGEAIAAADSDIRARRPVSGKVGARTVRFERGSDGGVRAFDDATGAELAATKAYWFAWATFYPDSVVAKPAR